MIFINKGACRHYKKARKTCTVKMYLYIKYLYLKFCSRPCIKIKITYLQVNVEVGGSRYPRHREWFQFVKKPAENYLKPVIIRRGHKALHARILLFWSGRSLTRVKYVMTFICMQTNLQHQLSEFIVWQESWLPVGLNLVSMGLLL